MPDKNVDQFVGLVQEIISVPLTKEAACNLLRGSPLAFHNVLLPIEGESWHNLIAKPGQLQITKPPLRTFGFGEVDDEDEIVADATVALNAQFRFRGRMDWSGEGFLAAEHRGEWHMLPLDGPQRSFVFNPGFFEVPLSRDGKPRYLREKEKTGYYRYFVIGLSGRLTDNIRHKIHSANPFSQLELDVLASMVLQLKPTARAVLGASLRVT